MKKINSLDLSSNSELLFFRDFDFNLPLKPEEIKRIWSRVEEVDVIPIEWLKTHLPNNDDYIRMKGYRELPEDDLMNIAYDNGFYAGWEAFRKALLEDTLEEDWREENETERRG